MLRVCISLWNIARTSPTLFASHFDNIYNQCVAFRLYVLRLLLLLLLLLLSSCRCCHCCCFCDITKIHSFPKFTDFHTLVEKQQQKHSRDKKSPCLASQTGFNVLQSSIREDIRQHSALIILDMHVLFRFEFERIVCTCTNVWSGQAGKQLSKHVCTDFHVIHWYLIQSHQHQQHQCD